MQAFAGKINGLLTPGRQLLQDIESRGVRALPTRKTLRYDGSNKSPFVQRVGDVRCK